MFSLLYLSLSTLFHVCNSLLSLSCFSLCPSSSGLPRSHLSHLQWKHPNLQMLSINHLRSNYNPINLCFHASCCRTASTPPYSITLLKKRQTDRAGGRVEGRVRFNGIKTESEGEKDTVDRQILCVQKYMDILLTFELFSSFGLTLFCSI